MPNTALRLIEDAKKLERLGCFSVVLECVPNKVGQCVSTSLSIPTIGIGAGPRTDGQVLVLHDLLGVDPDFNPKFLRRYANARDLIKDAVDHYHQDVVARDFPSLSESYG